MQYLKNKDLKYWIALLVIVAVLFFIFSDKEFSVLFTLSGTVQTFGFALIVIKITRSRSVAGLSKQMFICYTTVFSIRAVLFLFYKGYLPFDSTGDVIFKVQQFLATALSAFTVYLITKKYTTSYQKSEDTIKSWYLMIAAFIFAVLFHPNLNRNFFADFAWAFSQYLQTISLLPQFILFNKKGGQIQSYTSHFIASQAISRVLSIIFWIFTYSQLNETDRSRSYSVLPEYVGHAFIISQVIHLLIMADFMYYWIRALTSGKNVQLPTYI